MVRRFLAVFVKHLWAIVPAIISGALSFYQWVRGMNQTPPLWLFWILLLGGVALAGYLTYRELKKQGIQSRLGLHDIVPTLQQMDSFLRGQAHIIAKEPYDKKRFSELVIQINAEISGISPEVFERAMSVTDMSDAVPLARQIQATVVQKYANKPDEWDKSAEAMAGALDNRGFALKKVKAKGKYKQLTEALTECRNSIADPGLNKYIENHIKDSEVLNTLLVVADREPDFSFQQGDKQITAADFTPLPLLSMFEGFERKINKRMSDTRTNINRRIEFLEAKGNKTHGQKKGKKKR